MKKFSVLVFKLQWSILIIIVFVIKLKLGLRLKRKKFREKTQGGKSVGELDREFGKTDFKILVSSFRKA